MVRARLHRPASPGTAWHARGASADIRRLVATTFVATLGFLGGCEPEPPPPAARTEIDVPSATNDVLKQLGEVVTYNEAGEPAEAIATWETAQRTYSATLASAFRSTDPERTLQVEYRLGQLRRHIGTTRGKPGEVLANIEADLDTLAATAGESGTR